MKKYIIQIGPGKSMPGGMLEVIQQILHVDMPSVEEKRVHIPTAAKKNKRITFVIALLRILFLAVFNKIAIAHIHMSERGSVERTKILVKVFYLFKIKTIVHSHGGEIENEYNKKTEIEKTEFKKIFEHIDVFIVLTDGWKQFWKQIVPEEKIRILPNGVIIPSEQTKEYKKGNILHLLFMGYIGKVKGTYDLLQALAIVKKQRVNFQLAIAGNGEVDRCKKKVVEMNLDEEVHVIGWVSGKQKEELLQDADILILPSHFESFGIVALEAMARKVPVICGNKGYTKEVIIDGYTGLVAETGDAEDIAEKIIALNNVKDLTILGSNGYEVVIKKYEIKIVMSELEKIYGLLLQA